MDAIADNYIVAHKSDVDYDKAAITEHENDSIFEGIWLVRDFGTFLPRLTNTLDPRDLIDGVYALHKDRKHKPHAHGMGFHTKGRQNNVLTSHGDYITKGRITQ